MQMGRTLQNTPIFYVTFAASPLPNIQRLAIESGIADAKGENATDKKGWED
jgi:hypothetical protein